MKKRYKIVIVVLAVLIVLRLLLPTIVLNFLNKSLANMKGYYGQIEDIDIALYRGAYKIKKLYLNKVDTITQEQTEFVKIKQTDLSIEWNALFNGKIVGEIYLEEPSVIFTKEKVETKQVIQDSSEFKKVFEQAMPLSVNKLEVQNGRIGYRDFTSKPNVDVKLTDLYLLAQNLTNSTEETDILPSPVKMSATIYEGQLTMDMGLNLLAIDPTFDMTAELKNTNLVLLNEFMQAYGKFDVNKGEFGLYTEFAAKDGGFKGYVKPFIKDLDVRGKEDQNDGFLQKTWESIVGGVGVVFKNQKKDQLATKVPIEGNFNNPDVNILEAIWQVLKNAFIKALMPAVDQQININSVDEEVIEDKNFFQKVFGGGKKKDKKEEKENDK